jgi:hypothetical protein
MDVFTFYVLHAGPAILCVSVPGADELHALRSSHLDVKEVTMARMCVCYGDTNAC